jgi:hypothetical protein
LSIIIGKPELTPQNGDLTFSVEVDFLEKRETLWFRLKKEYAYLVSDRSDAPLVALLIPAMVLGEDIHLKGTISEKIYYNLSGPFQKVLKLIIPSLHIIKIFPADVQPAYQQGTGVGMGFSAGIDSFCVLSDHHYTDVPEGFQVTHLLYNNVGSWDHGEKGRRLFQMHYEMIKPVTERIGLPFIAIDSNVDSFYEGLGFQQTHTLRNASVALLLQKGIKKFLYASGVHYSNAFVGVCNDTAYSDTISLPLLSTEALDLISDGSEYTRVEKTLKVAKIEDSYKFLDVCAKGDSQINCSRCWKCKRTMLTLDIAGFLNRYSEVFDLDIYRQSRDMYIAEVLKSKNPLLREIVSFMKTSGFKIPLSSRFYAVTRIFALKNQYKGITSLLRLKVRNWR